MSEWKEEIIGNSEAFSACDCSSTKIVNVPSLLGEVKLGSSWHTFLFAEPGRSEVHADSTVHRQSQNIIG